MASNLNVQVLKCDLASITFPASLDSSDLPKISSPQTLEAFKLAVHHLLDLEDVVAFTTETVYGLGANALSPTSVARIFSTKGRPQDNPLIVHISSLPMLYRILPDEYALPVVYRALISEFWPGPLTLLFPADPKIIPLGVTAGHPTVAVRMPAHPVARALIALSDAPLAAPSANSSGKPSATRAEHVVDDLGATGRLRVILDGGPCPVGVESTVVDGLGMDGNLRVLRPGGVTVEDMKRVMDTLDVSDDQRPKVLVHRRDYEDTAMENAPTTPGMKYRHYSPSVPVAMLMTTSTPPEEQTSMSFSEALRRLVSSNQDPSFSTPPKVGLIAPSDSPLIFHLPSNHPSVTHFALGTRADPAMSAARLFDGLLTLEKDGADIIIVEEISEDREGLAFMNRARKAAGTFLYVH